MSDPFRVGDPVSKVGGDYRFDGVVVAAFPKLSGVIRYVVEDDRGVLFIYGGKNLAIRVEPPPTAGKSPEQKVAQDEEVEDEQVE